MGWTPRHEAALFRARQLGRSSPAPVAHREPAPEPSNFGAAARLALADRLRDAGYEVSLFQIRLWSRAQQGQAYQWALAFAAGREDLPPPMFFPPRGGRE